MPFYQSGVTYRYREFPVPGICHFVGGAGTGIGEFGTLKKSRKNLVLEKKSLNRYRKNLVPKKVSEPVSEKFGAVKSPRTSIKIKLYFCQPILGFGRFMMVTAKLQNVMFFTQSKNSKLILPQENCLTILPISIVQFFFCFLSFSLCSNLSIWPGRQVVLHR